MADGKVPFGQDRETRRADAQKLIRNGLFAIFGGIGIAMLGQAIGVNSSASLFLLIIGVISLVTGLMRRHRGLFRRLEM